MKFRRKAETTPATADTSAESAAEDTAGAAAGPAAGAGPFDVSQVEGIAVQR